MADLEITWRGLALGGGGQYHVEELTGWDELPEITSYDQDRARGHGDHVGDQFARARIVTAVGSIASLAARNELAVALQSASPVSSEVEDLTVETFGRRFTAGARLVRRSLPVGENYAAGSVPFALQWRCPDPLRYGPVLSESTGLPTTSGGLTYPLAYPLDYGAVGATGQIVLTNDGTADTSIAFTVTGSLPQGFEISAGARRLTYPVPVSAGEVLTIDTGTGTALAQGTADRRSNLVVADWLQVPAGGALTVQFTSLGGAFDAAASLTASWRSASW